MYRSFKVIKIAGWVLLGIIIMGFLNYCIIEPIIIPNPCAYHINKTGSLFNLFYKIESNEGFHPFPTGLNSILTAGIGIVSGLALYKYLKKLLAK